MYLKSLQLQGFKSFPDKTEIKFTGGMTAIVGPNGSGKSNISDAIRWVLGEQSSKSLRGAKMEDVIFGGTQKRGPVGFAEVSLILDNSTGIFQSEYTEIMVTRRYYRSGESEYYINKKHVRLKDIHELFMDTGIGRDGYSVIGQGRIDEILSIRSEDRREIFEEAAGITKFRYRKEESERKLAVAEENLIRIRDICTELESQAGPLEAQAEKAKKYLILRDKVRSFEVSLWLLELELIKKNLNKNLENIEINANDLSAIKIKHTKNYMRSEKLTDEMQKIDISSETLRRQLHELEQNSANLQSELAVIDANIKNAKNNIENIQTELSSQSTKKSNMLEQISAKQELLGSLLEKQSEYEKNILECNTHIDSIRQRLSSLENSNVKARFDSICAEMNIEQNKRTIEQTNLDNTFLRKDTIDKDISLSSDKLKIEQEKHLDLKKSLEEKQEKLEGYKNILEGISLKAESRRKKVENIAQKKAALQSSFIDAQNRVKMLSEMQKDYEGFSRSVKLIMQSSDKGIVHGIHGAVSTLISVQDSYVVAIETALGGSASSIVVDDAESGKSAINFLKTKDGGRATFLPIDTIKPSVIKEERLDNEKGYIGIASTLVDCDHKYKNIIQNILGKTVVVQNMDCAINISKKYANRFRIVTLDGQVINAGGSMTGGSVSKTSGALSRANKLKEQQALCEKFGIQLEETDQEYQKAKTDLAVLDFDLKAIVEENKQVESDRITLHATITQHQALVESMQSHHEQLLREKQNIDGVRQEIISKLEIIDKKLQYLNEQYVTVQKHLEDIENQSIEHKSEIDQYIEQLTQYRTYIAEINAQLNANQNSLEELRSIYTDMTQSIDDREDLIDKYREDINNFELQLVEKRKIGQDAKDNIEKIRKLISSKIEQRMRLEAERSKIDKKSQEISQEILTIEREKSRLEALDIQLKNEERLIFDKMWENYELTPITAVDCRIPIENKSEAQNQMTEIKSQIRSLGNINIDAIEEFEKVNERLVFITEQRNDLEKAQAELYKIIEQLTENMKEIFASQFKLLNQYFGETFKEIFGGGYAELALEDTSDILSCGIEIRVCPPGKALKTITLLSGGEKAFVAIALYFAIIKVRPTPFCILDEIEAALDDVNVLRFAKYIRTLSDKTQFVVITHRRGTMEQSDMLYGVTMQEQGVSKLLMLNMSEIEQKLNIKLK